MNERELLINILGLEPGASDADITNAAQTFQSDLIGFKTGLEEEKATLENRATEAESKVTELTEAANKIANSYSELEKELVEKDLETFKDVITNADRVREQLLSNRQATITVLKNIKVPAALPPDKEPLHNSKTAEPPAPLGASQSPDEAEAARISNRARELMKTLRVSHQKAFLMAQKEAAK